jgi:hypothetical protein
MQLYVAVYRNRQNESAALCRTGACPRMEVNDLPLLEESRRAQPYLALQVVLMGGWVEF